MKAIQNKTITIAGWGYLARVAARHFQAEGWTVRVLSRQAGPANAADRTLAAEWYTWTGTDFEGALPAVDGAGVLLNLCGRSVNCRYHTANRRAILDSRVHSTRALGRALSRVATPPAVWLNAASATIYRHAEDRAMDERTGEVGSGFSVDVCVAWEREAQLHALAGIRQVLLRTSMVLGNGENSVYPVLSQLVRRGLGGRQGSGAQFVSWVHELDFVRALSFLIEQPLGGPVNVTAPNPVTNRFMMACFREQLNVPVGLPATRQMLAVGARMLRTETELILKSRRVVPGRLLDAGFRFEYPTFPAALAALAERDLEPEMALV